MNKIFKWSLIFLIQLLLCVLNLGLAYDNLNTHIDKFNMFISGLTLGGMVLCYFGFRFEQIKEKMEGKENE